MSRGGVTQSTRDAMARATGANASVVAIEPVAPKAPAKSTRRRRNTRLNLSGLGGGVWFLKPKFRFAAFGFAGGFACAMWFTEHVVKSRIADATRAYEAKREAARRIKRERADAAKRSGPIIEILDDDYEDGDPTKISDVGTSAEEYKMVLVARTDVPMSGGKLGAQCAHAAVGVVSQLFADSHSMLLGRWEADGSKKVTLGVGSKSKLEGIMAEAKRNRLPHYLVVDAGRTEVDPGTNTVLAIGPGPASAIDAVTGSLRLY